jgi:hypothetical protein
MGEGGEAVILGMLSPVRKTRTVRISFWKRPRRGNVTIRVTSRTVSESPRFLGDSNL